MNHWLMKSEPDECSIDDVLAARGGVTPWSGVRNYQARNFMRDAMRVGDGVLFYHSSCADPGIAGIAQVACAALLTDYVLTVAVSISSGVAQLASAFPWLQEHRVSAAARLVFAVMVINLRGVRESGAVFAIPTYAFLFAMSTTVGVGIYSWLAGTLASVESPPPLEVHGGLEPLTWFLLLHAFSSGTTALTGIDAISGGAAR